MYVHVVQWPPRWSCGGGSWILLGWGLTQVSIATRNTLCWFGNSTSIKKVLQLAHLLCIATSILLTYLTMLFHIDVTHVWISWVAHLVIITISWQCTSSCSGQPLPFTLQTYFTVVMDTGKVTTFAWNMSTKVPQSLSPSIASYLFYFSLNFWNP